MQKIYVVDDHPLIRLGYAHLIGEQPDLTLCGEASSAAQALEEIPHAKPDLVITDISLKGMNGIELVKQLQAQDPDLPILVVSIHDEMLYAERALCAGARGYLTKCNMDKTIIGAIRCMLEGGYCFSEEVNRKIYLRCQGKNDDGDVPALGQLTDRELEVFERYGDGLSTRQIAEALNISPKTVETHRGRIKQKLALDTSTAMLQQAVQWVQEQRH